MNIADLHYLYVEDDELSRQVMEMILRNGIGAANVTIFEDSTNFATRLAALDPCPDIILLDVHMEPITGFEMLYILQADARYSQAQVVALTASVMNEEVKQLREAGFTSAISKPVSVTTFPALIEGIIAGESVWHIG